MSAPYASANAGNHAREEITQTLRRFGCEEIGFLDQYERHEVLLHFTHRGRQVQLRASAKGWAALYLKQKPWTHWCRTPRVEYEQAALRQGHVAISSLLRDWFRVRSRRLRLASSLSRPFSCRTCSRATDAH